MIPLVKEDHIGIFGLMLAIGITLLAGLGGASGRGSPATAASVQRNPADLRRLVHLAAGRLTVRQCFQVAERAIAEGRARRDAWFAAGHRIDLLSPRYFAVAGKCYRKALGIVRHRIAKGLIVAQAERAKAIAYAAWWRFRDEPASDYPRTFSDLRHAVKLDPNIAIYWVMLAQVAWWQGLRPPEPHWVAAVKFLRRAVRADPRCAIAYWLLGQLMVSGPHYNDMKLKAAYDLKDAMHYDELCYANRKNFSEFFFYFSKLRIRNAEWNVKEALGIVPANTESPKIAGVR
jgi:tetratricopeptide (TPR) repeat protein